MIRAPLACCALLVLVAGFGGTSATGPSLDGLTVSVNRVTTVVYPKPLLPQSETFTLTCDPAGGTLPFADRVCGTIRAHPQAMLTAADPLSTRRTCTGSMNPFAPVVQTTVTVTFNGSTTELRGPGCEGIGVAWQIFAAASSGDERRIARLEAALRCVEEPIASILATLTPMTRQLCLIGAWTPRNERLIRVAKRTPVIAELGRARLFTDLPGTRACRLPVGGTEERPGIAATCGVHVDGETVYFSEEWSGENVLDRNFFLRVPTEFLRNPRTGSALHIWEVVTKNGRVVSVKQHGAAPPERLR